MSNTPSIAIIGGGLAGCEAAWQLARQGHRIILFEMKPCSFSPAHTSPHLAELVCSNSFRSNEPLSAVGLLKEEMRRMDSLIMEAANASAVPAGKALAVDRTLFSLNVEEKLRSQANVFIVREEVTQLPSALPVIIATGPLTSPALTSTLCRLTGTEHLYFYDAIAPIIDGDSIDYDKVFRASRYVSGEGDYLNCPLDYESYDRFWQMLVEAEKVPLSEYEVMKCFEGCLPIEVMAKRGKGTLRFGPMKPVGLIDPQTGKRPYAVVRLRKENVTGTRYNMVGFQTKLTWPEQGRIFRLIQGLEHAEFFRFGSMHRNTYINAPELLKKTLQLRKREDIFFAGQISGVEGYVESAAMGLIAGISAHFLLTGQEMPNVPETTAHGALIRHLTTAVRQSFEPMNINFGLFPPIVEKIAKRDRNKHYSVRALHDLDQWQQELRIH
jgi:methylenetetrahydrofolate--tRNA-(uracil-5-)-methyltransferase